MRKVEMAARIAAHTELTKTQVEQAVEAILAVIKDTLRQGEPVILRGLGTFAVRAKGARLGRNPKTGAAAAIPARRVVRFTAGQRFKQAVAAATPEAPAPPAPPAEAHGRAGAPGARPHASAARSTRAARAGLPSGAVTLSRWGRTGAGRVSQVAMTTPLAWICKALFHLYPRLKHHRNP